MYRPKLPFQEGRWWLTIFLAHLLFASTIFPWVIRGSAFGLILSPLCWKIRTIKGTMSIICFGNLTQIMIWKVIIFNSQSSIKIAMHLNNIGNYVEFPKLCGSFLALHHVASPYIPLSWSSAASLPCFEAPIVFGTATPVSYDFWAVGDQSTVRA